LAIWFDCVCFVGMTHRGFHPRLFTF